MSDNYIQHRYQHDHQLNKGNNIIMKYIIRCIPQRKNGRAKTPFAVSAIDMAKAGHYKAGTWYVRRLLH